MNSHITGFGSYGTVPSGGGGEILEGFLRWLDKQPKSSQLGFKVAGIGVVALGLYGLYSVISSSNEDEDYQSNRAVGKFAIRAKKVPKGGREKVKKGKIVTIKDKKGKERRFGHKIPPKRYYKMGARHPSDYAWPTGFKYPLVFHHSDGSINIKQTKKHIRIAKGYFTKSKKLYGGTYGKLIRETIAKNINKANEKFQVGPIKVKP